jgi:hypothetical protein
MALLLATLGGLLNLSTRGENANSTTARPEARDVKAVTGLTDGVLDSNKVTIAFTPTTKVERMASTMTIRRIRAASDAPVKLYGVAMLPTTVVLESQTLNVTLPKLPEGTYRLFLDSENQVDFSTTKVAKMAEPYTMVQQCMLINDLGRCLSVLYGNRLVDSDDSQAELVTIQEDVSKFPEMGQFCHLYTHALGSIEAMRDGLKTLRFPALAEICGTGFVHGMHESQAYFYTTTEIKQKLTQLCVAFDKWVSRCGHDEGHMSYLRAGGDYAVAIDICKGLQDPAELQDCASGATMSWVNDNRFPDGETKEKTLDRYGFCMKSEMTEVRKGCLEHLALALHSRDKDIANVMYACDHVTTDMAELSMCWRGLGYLIGGLEFTTRTDQNSAHEKLCLKAKTVDGAGQCLMQLAEFRTLNLGQAKAREETCARMTYQVKVAMTVCAASGDSRRSTKTPE